VAPESQTHIPWIVWLGKNYHDTNLSDLGKLADKPLSHDNIFHTLLGLFEIQVGVYDSSKDLIFQSRAQSGRRGEFD
jgi:lipid A ethanolaminephosphotransferase